MNTPLVIAHRGSSQSAPEHTLAAYEQAIADGADGWECDVRLTRDGHLVCLHDRKLDRTSNGRGAVSRHRLEQLQELDFGGWANRAAEVLTLETLLELFVDSGAHRLLIETKHPTRHGGLVEQRLVEMLKRFGLHNPPHPQDSRVVVMSMWPRPLRRVHLLAPTLPRARLLFAVPPLLRGGALPAGITIAGPWVRVLRNFPEYVERVHANGNQVFCWTVDEDEDIDLVTKLGVDVLITNRPAAVLARLGRGR